MLKNVIFDMGNVLIRYTPDVFVRCIDLPEEDGELLLRSIYRSPDWERMDSGELDEAGLEELVRQRVPERLYDAVHKLIFGWEEFAAPVEGMEDLVRECRAAGMGIYLLSNASVRQKEYWPTVPGSECFDGVVVSAYHRVMKPSPEIYRLVLDSYQLRAEECIFVDDSEKNVEAAIREGIHGFHFLDNAAELRKVMVELGAPFSDR